MPMIDIDRLICDLFTIEFDEEEKKNLKHKYDPKNAYAPIYMVQHAIYKALEKQGLEYIDGEIIELNPVFKPEKGKWYMCIKTVVMTPGGETAYKKGKIYKSEGDNFITDEQGETCHCWYEECDVFHKLYEHFRPATEKEIIRLAPLTDEQRAYIGVGLKNGSMIREKDLAYADEKKSGVQKFKEGDWVVRNGKLFQINHIEKVLDGTFHYWFTEGGWLHSKQMMNAHLWTLQDAKPGDVIKEDSCIFILETLESEDNAIVYCVLFDDGKLESRLHLCFDHKSTHPATKEQRDLLFLKMEEAGYKWNQKELKLEKIDQPDIAYINGAVSSDDEQGIDKLSCTSTKENSKPQTIKFNEPMTNAEKSYFSNMLFNDVRYKPIDFDKINIEKMVEDYKEEESKVLLPLGFSKGNIEHLSIAYKNGLEDMFKLIKKEAKSD